MIIAQTFTPERSPLALVLIVLIALLAVLVIARRFGWLPNRHAWLSALAPVGNRTTRLAEAIMLLCVAAAILVFTATNTSTGGRLLILHQLPAGLVTVNVVAAIAAAIGVLIGILLALFRRTSPGVVLAGGILCVYGCLLNSPPRFLEALVAEKLWDSNVLLVFKLSNPSYVEGAGLYVNGVHLGTLPCEISYDEFYRRVPFWENEPNENMRKNLQSWLHVLDYYPAGHSGRLYSPWAAITVPPPSAFGSVLNRDRGPTYYARVKWGEDWGFAEGPAGGSWGGPRSTVDLRFIFPDKQKRVERLLDVARLNDYSPNSDWFAAMESYPLDGWMAVRRAMESEPAMSRVLDAWAAWKYDLDKAVDPEAAWKILLRICGEADARHYYQTNDVTGRAMELLVPKLDPEKLVRFACRIVRSAPYYGWGDWWMNNRTQFTMSYDTRDSYYRGELDAGVWIAGRKGLLSPGDCAVAHAVWILNEAWGDQGRSGPNLVQEEFVPEFIRRDYSRPHSLQVAAYLGGPAIERFLLRRKWWVQATDFPRDQRTAGGMGRDVNGWLCLLANLQSPAGRTFRQENHRLLVEMADNLDGNKLFGDRQSEFDFAFLDLDLGTDSFAVRYWPKFMNIAAGQSYGALSRQYRYLLRMEPLSTVEMYVQCWREFRGDETQLGEVLRGLAKSSLPSNKRRQIYDGLVGCVQKDTSNIKSMYGGVPSLESRLLTQLKWSLVPPTDDEQAEEVLGELRTGSRKYEPNDVADWLAHGASAHPLVRMLAEANEPVLRLLVMGALREHPMPENRAILEKLVQDKDERVRRAAEAVAEELKALRDTPIRSLSNRALRQPGPPDIGAK